MEITVKGVQVTLTQNTIWLTREWFANNARGCIGEVISGAVKVNDLEKYIADQEAEIDQALNGDFDHTFTFIQMAWYIQSGECVGLLG